MSTTRAAGAAPAIELRELRKAFGSNEVLQGVNLSVAQGQVVCVIGASGSGKSTLLRCVNRLEEPTGGAVLIDGIDITHPDCDVDLVRRRIGMVFQQFNLFPHLRAIDNVTLAQRKVLGRSKAEATQVATEMLERVGLADKASGYPAQLSGGQQQRVAIARTLIQNPKILLADEPVASLDPRNTRAVMDALQQLNRRHGITVLCNLHSLELARGYCTRLIGIKQGSVVFDGLPEALTEDAVINLYGLEAKDVTDVPLAAAARAIQPVPAFEFAA